MVCTLVHIQKYPSSAELTHMWISVPSVGGDPLTYRIPKQATKVKFLTPGYFEKL